MNDLTKSERTRLKDGTLRLCQEFKRESASPTHCHFVKHNSSNRLLVVSVHIDPSDQLKPYALSPSPRRAFLQVKLLTMFGAIASGSWVQLPKKPLLKNGLLRGYRSSSVAARFVILLRIRSPGKKVSLEISVAESILILSTIVYRCIHYDGTPKASAPRRTDHGTH